ncbi:hypothetical protein SCFA_790002 [anaerobic digester metagenome]|jgi:hypothetical protein|uniref:Uncharacterized protein n=1 Tax=anaerobic digester metagenome TaxID=1263854 RepID=A0A485M4C3_9ZZZZ
MKYNYGVLPEKKVSAAGTGAVSHIGSGSFRRNHRLYLKEPGDCHIAIVIQKGLSGRPWWWIV